MGIAQVLLLVLVMIVGSSFITSSWNSELILEDHSRQQSTINHANLLAQSCQAYWRGVRSFNGVTVNLGFTVNRDLYYTWTVGPTYPDSMFIRAVGTDTLQFRITPGEIVWLH